MNRQLGHRVVVIMLLLLAASATYLQAECTQKETLSFESASKRLIATAGFTADYRIYNDGTSDLKAILKKPNSPERVGIIGKGETIDIAKSDDETLTLLATERTTTGSFQLIWVK